MLDEPQAVLSRRREPSPDRDAPAKERMKTYVMAGGSNGSWSRALSSRTAIFAHLSIFFFAVLTSVVVTTSHTDLFLETRTGGCSWDCPGDLPELSFRVDLDLAAPKTLERGPATRVGAAPEPLAAWARVAAAATAAVMEEAGLGTGFSCTSRPRFRHGVVRLLSLVPVAATGVAAGGGANRGSRCRDGMGVDRPVEVPGLLSVWPILAVPKTLERFTTPSRVWAASGPFTAGTGAATTAAAAAAAAGLDEGVCWLSVATCGWLRHKRRHSEETPVSHVMCETSRRKRIVRGRPWMAQKRGDGRWLVRVLSAENLLADAWRNA